MTVAVSSLDFRGVEEPERTFFYRGVRRISKLVRIHVRSSRLMKTVARSEICE